MNRLLLKSTEAALLCTAVICLNSCFNKNAKSSGNQTNIVKETTIGPAGQEPLSAPCFQPGNQVPDVWVEKLGASSFFSASPISDDIFALMDGNSFKEGCPVAREELRYLTALHKDGQGRTFLGEMVVNASIAQDVLEILRSLYDASYPIEKMRLIDHYGADDQASMEDNNSSAFNFRPRAHQTAISKHALGLAIDINPLYNPYVLTTESGYRIVEPASAGAYLDRSADFPYKIERDDLCCTLFREHGFYWGGGWASRTKDFQHFER